MVDERAGGVDSGSVASTAGGSAVTELRQGRPAVWRSMSNVAAICAPRSMHPNRLSCSESDQWPVQCGPMPIGRSAGPNVPCGQEAVATAAAFKGIVMRQKTSVAPIVVGIDGSDAAINAALWAVDEAIARDVPVRLIHVTDIEERPRTECDRLEVQYGESVLRAASAEITGTSKAVKVEAEIRWGRASRALITESRAATMLCVGSVGIGWVAGKVLGSTAAAVARGAYCPVAIIRSPRTPHAGVRCLVVRVDNSLRNDAVVARALEEAHLRKAPVLALGAGDGKAGAAAEFDRRVDRWRKLYPDVDIHPLATESGVGHFLAAHQGEAVDLAVIASSDVDEVVQIIGPHEHPLFDHAECSVLVVR